MAPKIDDICNFLATRNLPDWMVAQLRTGLEEKVPLDSDVTVASFFTKDTLLEMGIAHPLHQRRILREVQCFMKSFDGAADSLPAPGSGPSKVRAKPRQLVYERDMRWPFLDIACVKLPTVEKTSSMTSPYGHCQRRMELEAKTRPVGMNLCPRDPSKDSFASDGKTSEASAALGHAGDIAASVTREVADDDTVASDLSDGHSMEWQEWLNSRLHSWGMLSLVDEVLKTATLGDLTQLQELVAQVQSNGASFCESLEKTPLPSHLQFAFPDAPADDIPPSTIWEWVIWRLDCLERADSRLHMLLEKCGILADQVTGYSVSRDVSVRPVVSERKKTMNMKKLLLGVSSTSAAFDQPSRSPSPVSATFLETATSAVRMKNETKLSALERFQKVAQQIVSHIRSKRQEGLVGSTKLLTCVAMQSKVTNLRHDLENMMDDVDKWPRLISEERESCDSMVSRLHQASQTLFHRFVDLRQHVEVELRNAMEDQGSLDAGRLETKIIDVQRELASSLLLGPRALLLAEETGLALKDNGIPEPPNPWEELDVPEPPWEGSFMRAVRTLFPAHQNTALRRTATSITASSSPRRQKSSKTRFQAMKGGKTIPEEILAQLLKH